MNITQRYAEHVRIQFATEWLYAYMRQHHGYVMDERDEQILFHLQQISELYELLMRMER